MSWFCARTLTYCSAFRPQARIRELADQDQVSIARLIKGLESYADQNINPGDPRFQNNPITETSDLSDDLLFSSVPDSAVFFLLYHKFRKTSICVKSILHVCT